MKPDAYLKLYPGDWLKDTLHLDATATGAYFLLILAHRGKPGVPSSDSALKVIARVRDQDWMRVKGEIKPFFTEKDGLWVNKRCLEDWKRDCEDYQYQLDQAARARTFKKGHAKVSTVLTPTLDPKLALTLAPTLKPMLQSESESESESLKANRAAVALAEVMERCQGVLGLDEMKARHKHWLQRAESNLGKLERVVADTEAAAKEGRIKTTPARYAEDAWKRFAD